MESSLHVSVSSAHALGLHQRNGTDPFSTYGSRCLTILWKSVCSHPNVQEFISMSTEVREWTSLYPRLA